MNRNEKIRQKNINEWSKRSLKPLNLSKRKSNKLKNPEQLFTKINSNILIVVWIVNEAACVVFVRIVLIRIYDRLLSRRVWIIKEIIKAWNHFLMVFSTCLLVIIRHQPHKTCRKVCFYSKLFQKYFTYDQCNLSYTHLKICKNTNITVNKMRYPIPFQIYKKSMSGYFIADATFLW